MDDKCIQQTYDKHVRASPQAKAIVKCRVEALSVSIILIG